jgi:quercetin dioxygenase-like cupin family protein
MGAVPGFVVAEQELESRRADADTASRAVAIDARTGSEQLELHVVRYEPGRSLPRTLDAADEIMYAVSGAGTVLIEGEPHELAAGTGAYVAAGESFEVENAGPEALAVISVLVPPTGEPRPPNERRTVRYDDQPPLPAGGDREFRYLVTGEVGCRTATQFFGLIAPGRAPEHGHVYDEVIHVLEGEGALHADGASKPVRQGSSIHLPPLLEHSLENSGDATMRIIAVFHPAGDPASRAYEANE